MSTPVVSAGSARRAMLRWAWRLFRREWRQQLLVLGLMTVAVTAAVAVAAIAVTAAASSQPDFGDAHALARLDAKNPQAARVGVASARQRFGAVEVIEHTSASLPGSVERLDLRAENPKGTFSRPLLALRAGRYPTKPGEVALTDAVGRLLDSHVGSRVTLGRVERTVVGQVENPRDLNDEFALITPSDSTTADSLTLLFNQSHGGGVATSGRGQRQVDFGIEVRGNNGPVAALVLVAVTLVMALVGLIAAAGFVVVAQRRQRQLGLLAALGATGRHLRLVMLANGAIVGAVAAILGLALGVLGWSLAAPAVEVAAGHRIGRFDLPWALIAACGFIAVVMATAASWWPARVMARMPVMGALSGRPSRPSPIHRSLVVAVVFAALGMAGIAAAHPTAEHVRPALLIAGIVAVVVGVVFAAPAAIRAAGVPSGRLPFAARLALRDLVRYHARAAAALAAITLVLGISVTIIGISKANEYRADEGNLSNRELLIRVGDTPVDPRLLDGNAATVAAALGDPKLLTLDFAMVPDASGDPDLRKPVSLGSVINAHSTRMIDSPYVASPELLARYHIDPQSIEKATDLLTVRKDRVILVDFTVRPDPGAVSHVQRVALPKYSSAPNSLITDNALRRHGWLRARAGWLVDSKRPLTTAQIASARATAAKVGLAIETRSSQDGLATLRTVATTVGALLALAIVAMTIGLIRGEGTRDLRTLTATGAASRTRRTLTATTAGALAFLGVALGTAGAYAALVAAYGAELDQLLPLPVGHLLLLAVGLPAVATIAGWLLAGREPRSFSHQALD